MHLPPITSICIYLSASLSVATAVTSVAAPGCPTPAVAAATDVASVVVNAYSVETLLSGAAATEKITA